MPAGEARHRVTINDLQKKKQQGDPILSIGVFDWPTATIADRLGMDLLIIGDAGGVCLFGHQDMTTIEADEMLYLTRAVARGAQYGMVVTDMPFMTYHYSTEDAIRNAARFIAKGGARAVKCEGDHYIAKTYVEPIARAGIAVMAHIGIQGFRLVAERPRVRGKTMKDALEIIRDAEAMVEAGCFALLCELITPEVVGYLRKTLPVPVISLGSGTDADGVYIISSDMLRMCGCRTPKSAKVYADVSAVVESAFQEYITDVKERRYPGPEHTVHMLPDEMELFLEHVAKRQGG